MDPPLLLSELEAEVTAAERLDRWLVARHPEFSRSRWVAVIEAGHVTVSAKSAKPGLQLQPGWRVRYRLPADPRVGWSAAALQACVPIAFEDEFLLVVDKPRGLAVHPAPGLREPTLVDLLSAQNVNLSEGSEAFRPGLVHRIDKETSGLLILAKSNRAHAALARQIARKEATRVYVAVVSGEYPTVRNQLTGPIGRDPRNRVRMAVLPEGRPASTFVRRLAVLHDQSVLAVQLETGRTHQIRVHLATFGYPVIGDAVYGTGPGPMQLHAGYLRFRHPELGEIVEVHASVPADMPSAQNLPQDWYSVRRESELSLD